MTATIWRRRPWKPWGYIEQPGPKEEMTVFGDFDLDPKTTWSYLDLKTMLIYKWQSYLATNDYNDDDLDHITLMMMWSYLEPA